MDLTFRTREGVFNYRVCAVILDSGRLLAMKNDNTPYYYLPGGRVMLHEDADTAIRRELREELGIEANIVRPLWWVQSFFEEDESRVKFHELCLYYLVDVSKTALPAQEHFAGRETKHHEIFDWLPIDTLKEQYLYPLFIKEEIHHLPAQLALRTEREYGH